jgi:hypothetical protein
MFKSHPWISSAACVIVALLGTLFVRTFIQADAGYVNFTAATHSIPPIFGNQRFLLGVTMSLLSIVSLLAMQALLENIRFLMTNQSSGDMPVKVAVKNESIILAALVATILPDVLVLYAWGELMAPSNASMSKFDRVFDNVSAVLFIWWAIRRLRSRPTILFQLQRQPIPVDTQATWAQLKPKLLISAAIVVVSVGVAFGK